MARYATYGGAINAEGAFKPLQHLFRTGFSYGLATTQRGAGANMSVDVSAGGASHVTTGGVGYYGWADATENVAVSASSPSNPRKDILVSYIDLALITTASTNNVNALKFMVVAGTAAASPTDPSDPTIQAAVGAGNPFNKIARIDVATSASSIVTANITNLKVPMALAVPYLYGGSSNTNGHTVPNVADDTVALLAATQTLTNKTINASQLVDGSLTNAKLSTATGEIGAAWATWSPTPTNLTVGNGTVNAKYLKVGKHITAHYSLVFGSTTAVSGDISMTLPVTALAYGGAGVVPIGSVNLFDTSVARIFQGTVNLISTSALVIRPQAADLTYLYSVLASATQPFTWATGDEIGFTITYEAA